MYGQRHVAHASTPPVPDRLGWTPWEGIEPGAELLGDVAGRSVLDIGSGAGHHAVKLAQAYGARVTGIELSPTQHKPACVPCHPSRPTGCSPGQKTQTKVPTSPHDASSHSQRSSRSSPWIPRPDPSTSAVHVGHGGPGHHRGCGAE
ncbi:SAM-dependent methyltransferase [Streptomyces zhihengii]|uniref:SAM-dependent methyltransferase n=1 Tax=Streptomyces zhihengii TaxID=1818004 RepID=UPI003641AA58